VQGQSVPYNLANGPKPFGNVYTGRRGPSRMGMMF
jgi:hypothetical protein